MNNIQSCQDLNVRAGATEAEIKAAFRQLARENHPDSGVNGGNTVKFRTAYEAYQKLLSEARSNQKSGELLGQTPFQFLNRTRNGLDVYYDLALVKKKGSFKITVPWTSEEACPRCFGQGHTLTQLNYGSVYRPTPCSRCGGTGHADKFSHLEVKVSPEMVRSGKIRLKGAGSYDPKTAQRGDLYLNLNFVDRLAKSS
ncbi:MAG: DnaJ domain-containing protein [Deltaproteobacteria bacterium]|jgi:DnaJ-class molecular chaperone|nr:DnaJ domain-containing protein [Deltaproteobacteria bacterium]